MLFAEILRRAPPAQDDGRTNVEKAPGVRYQRGVDHGRMRQAVELLDSLVLAREFSEFLTLPAYRLLG